MTGAGERWSTQEEVFAARSRLEDAIEGWQRPAAHALGYEVDGAIRFEHVNHAAHWLPAVALATVCGHVRGSASYPLGLGDLDRAIALVAPAEAWTGSDHPNLWTWRRLRATLPPDATVWAVFAGDPGDDGGDPRVAALLATRSAAPGAGG